jgi:hypothetical protein
VGSRRARSHRGGRADSGAHRRRGYARGRARNGQGCDRRGDSIRRPIGHCVALPPALGDRCPSRKRPSLPSSPAARRARPLPSAVSTIRRWSAVGPAAPSTGYSSPGGVYHMRPQGLVRSAHETRTIGSHAGGEHVRPQAPRRIPCALVGQRQQCRLPRHEARHARLGAAVWQRACGARRGADTAGPYSSSGSGAGSGSRRGVRCGGVSAAPENSIRPPMATEKRSSGRVGVFSNCSRSALT